MEKYIHAFLMHEVAAILQICKGGGTETLDFLVERTVLIYVQKPLFYSLL